MLKTRILGSGSEVFDPRRFQSSVIRGPDWTNKVDKIKAALPGEIRDNTIIAKDGLEISL